MMYCAIVYARYNSSRLPGKVLMEVGDQTILGICVEKLRPVKNLKIIVATSDQETDDPIVAWCKANNTLFFRGSLDDVAARTSACLKANPCDAFFRINADSPFLQPALIEEAVAIFEEEDYDIITNIQQRSYPYGIAVELICSSAFLREAEKFSAFEKEHITSFFYNRPDNFRIRNIRNTVDLSNHRFVLDTPEDFEKLLNLYKKDNNILKYDLLNLLKITKSDEEHLFN
jgi:spore coat polysaccharide biosynthesis protein SpsF